MVINYKKLNDNIVFDGYYIPNKTILFGRIQRASWFSKMDCKSGYWQIKWMKKAFLQMRLVPLKGIIHNAIWSKKYTSNILKKNG